MCLALTFPTCGQSIVFQGKEVQQRIERQIAEAVAGSFVISLGGVNGEGWGRCLAVQVSLLHIHSRLASMLLLLPFVCDSTHS